MIDDDRPAARRGAGGSSRAGAGTARVGRGVAAAADQRDDDPFADAGVLQLLQRRGVDGEDAAIHLDEREQHLIAQAGLGQLDDVPDGHGLGAAEPQQRPRPASSKRGALANLPTDSNIVHAATPNTGWVSPDFERYPAAARTGPVPRTATVPRLIGVRRQNPDYSAIFACFRASAPGHAYCSPWGIRSNDVFQTFGGRRARAWRA